MWTRILSNVSVAVLAAVVLAAAVAADPPVTLRLAFYGPADHPMARPAATFIDEVERRSDGSIIVEAHYEAGEDRTPSYEEGVATLLVEGGADIALTTTRSLDAAGVDSLQALHAPLLIDDMALATAVAQSDLATDLLAAMADDGVMGLSIWPEDLEHPVTFLNCTERLVDPAQFRGITVRDVASTAMDEIITTLGATPVFVDEYGDEVLRCEIDAAEVGLRRASTLPGPTPITGDVTLLPRLGVLAVNLDSWERLTAEQQVLLRDAGIAARDGAISTLVAEADAAADWCDQGGEIVIAGPEAVARFAEALVPITDRLTADPIAGPAIGAILALKSLTPREAAPQPCGTAGAGPTPALTIRSTEGYLGTMLPDGTYRATVTTEDLLAAGASQNFAQRNAGVFTLTVRDGSTEWAASEAAPCDGTISSDGTIVVIRELVPDTCVGGAMLWRPADEGFWWYVPANPDWSVTDNNDVAAFFDRIWVRID